MYVARIDSANFLSQQSEVMGRSEGLRILVAVTPNRKDYSVYSS